MPPASPHNRKTGPSGEEEEEEDLVDKLIRNTGCEKEHYLVQVVELQPNHAHRYRQSRTGVSINRYISISILLKYSNFNRFYKKMGPFYKKLRCDKFGNLSISTKNALNNQIQSSMKIYMYIVC